MKVGCVGELVVDFISRNPTSSIQEAVEFVKCPGGSPAHVAATLHDLGLSVTLISKTGKGEMGSFVREAAINHGLSTRAILTDVSRPTRCVFIAYDEEGRRSIEIANRGSADQFLQFEELDPGALVDLDALHIGGTTMLGETTSATAFILVEKVKRSGGIISFDPNINLHHISKPAKERVTQLLPLIDILKVNEEEWGAVQRILSSQFVNPPKIVVLTRGSDGAVIKIPDQEIEIRAREVKVVDATGAGDAFFAVFLEHLLSFEGTIQQTTSDQLEAAGVAGSREAAKVIQHFGGALASPSK